MKKFMCLFYYLIKCRIMLLKTDNIVFNNNNIILTDFNNINRYFMTIGSAWDIHCNI
jgi:hypothetical protein